MDNNMLHRKERLVLTAIEIIEELGIQGLTTREIARRQEVSEATLFRHFKNKNELLAAVLDYYTQFDYDVIQTIEINHLRPLEAIKYIANTYAVYYENYPEITAMTQLYDVVRYEEGLADKINGIFNSRMNFLQQLIQSAQRENEISEDVDSEVVALMITGTIRELCLKWRFENRAFSLKEKILTALETILNALQKKSVKRKEEYDE